MVQFHPLLFLISYKEAIVNKNVLKWGGVVAVVVGSVALYLSGTGEAAVVAVVGAVFVLVGVIGSIFA